MRSQVVVAAPAKINLQLAVGRARKDGFHPLATVYQAISLCDEIVVRPSARTQLSVVGDGVDATDVPTDDTNLALRAAALLAARHGITDGVEMVIRKRIPVSGGMAGGSADAAGALVACDALWETRTPREELMAIAAELGSDVPFCLVGGTAIGSGRGEIVTPAMARGHYWWVIAISGNGLSTAQVYAEFDKLHGRAAVPEPEISEPLMSALRSGDVEKLGAALDNDLQPAAIRLRPELEHLLATGIDNSAHGGIVSGSGPSCLFLAEGEAHAAQIDWALRGDAGVAHDHVLFARGPVPGARVIG